MSKTLVLVGLMGTGKSTIAKEYAKRAGCAVLDTDRMIESDLGKSVREIFEEHGEEEFRRRESDVLVRALSHDDAVIAAAGGVVISKANRDALIAARKNRRATVVWLRANPEVLVERTSRGTHRPLLDRDPHGALQALADSRHSFYEEVSDVEIDTDTLAIDEIVDTLVELMSRDRVNPDQLPHGQTEEGHKHE